LKIFDEDRNHLTLNKNLNNKIMAYKRGDLDKIIKNPKIEVDTFYKEKFNNYIGKTSDTEEYYSEIIAAELLNTPEFFDKIKSIKRESIGKSYLTKSHHDGTFSINEKSNRHEEKFAKLLFDKNNNYSSLGKIIDFQVPLKDKQKDKAGKIDLISFDKNNSTLYLIELKYGENTETLLRAILEIYTYYKIVDEGKLKNDFKNLLLEASDFEKIQVKPAVMLVKDLEKKHCKSFLELEEIKKGERINLKKLAAKMNITFFKSIDGKEFEIISACNL